MDSRRLAIVVFVSMGLLFLWVYTGRWLQSRHPEWFRERSVPRAAAPAPSPATEPGSAVAGPAEKGRPAAGIRVAPATRPVPAAIGQLQFDPQRKSPYAVGLRINPHGASLDSASLPRFRAEVGRDEPYVFQQRYPTTDPSMGLALATRSIRINEQAADLTEAPWDLRSAGRDFATYGVEIQSADGQAILEVEKTFQVLPAADPSAGYEVKLTYRFRNPTTQPVAFQAVFNGPHVPTVESSRDATELVYAYNDANFVAVKHEAASGFTPEKPARSLKHDKGLGLLWAGFVSSYFNAILRPEVGPEGKSSWLADVFVQAAAKRSHEGQDFISLRFETPEIILAAGQTQLMPLHVYLGPRQRAVLNSSYYAVFPLSYNKTLVMTSGLCAFCTFQWLINLLVLMLSGFHWLFGGFAGKGDWGLAIIALVLVVRLLLHPITKKSQISMSKMSKMGPEIERLKKKYGDNKEELNRAMMEFYKEQGFTPVLGCLPMLLQMPIWIALWSCLQSTFELRHASFLWGFTWIRDLAQPDRLLTWRPINLWIFELNALNLLPILMAIVFWLQQRLTPKPAAMTAEQQQQQKMMQWMSLLFPVLLYTGPSGLNLYILTSTAIGIWESKRVRDHIQAQEEAERAGKVIVDTKATRVSKKLLREERGESRPKGRLATWLADLQKRAESLRQQQRRERGQR